jgi:hypothetical protein
MPLLLEHKPRDQMSAAVTINGTLDLCERVHVPRHVHLPEHGAFFAFSF